MKFVSVSVPETDVLEMDTWILGYGSILGQMTKAAGILRCFAPDAILNIGGDCGIEPAPISYLNHKHQGDFTLVCADMNTPETSHSGHFLTHCWEWEI